MHNLYPQVEPILVLRKKAHMPTAKVEHLKQMGVRVHIVNNWSHITTIMALIRLCLQLRPDIFVAHGFSEHIWGRIAAIIAKVPHIVQVEHNTRERYTRLRLALSRWLNRYTDALVGCSEGVRQVLLKRGYPQAKCIAISNGINTRPFVETPAPLVERKRQIIMISRIAKQKDHATLIRAVAQLKSAGIELPLLLVGKGKSKITKQLTELTQALGVDSLVQFCGYRSDVPKLLNESRIFVQCTHYEGMPLTLIEAMAAGCAVIGSEVPGVQETIEENFNGLLHRHASADDLAQKIKRLLDNDDFAQQLAVRAREQALSEYSQEQMNHRYYQLFQQLISHNGNPNAF
ncbi:glycosyltransferase [Idiomarina seosinensis]|uniref:Glycosyltransferase n=2 Tax=Idiomarina seosinensis TaxID=281739 RepID=A0A432ZEA0_9GAMM|nr:glycosyltransferase [Idiomarina seosinensis]